jgi:GrpB-like predicted nucleotidyltransferase (UPF0157 family)
VTLVTNIGRGRWQTALVPATSHALRHVGATTDEPGLIHITLLPHDPAWARRYARERDRICCALGGRAVRIEHVGSTAVPGLRAKPILDVAVGVASPSEDDLRRRLEPLGLVWRGDVPSDGGLLFVLEERPDRGVAHVHVVELGGDEWRQYLAFRDRLRRDPPARAAYLELKETLAARFPHDRRAYTDAKAAFIEALLAGEI